MRPSSASGRSSPRPSTSPAGSRTRARRSICGRAARSRWLGGARLDRRARRGRRTAAPLRLPLEGARRGPGRAARPKATRRSSSSRSTPEGDGTRLRVHESGFAALAYPEERRKANHDDNVGGWEGMTRRAARVRGAGDGLSGAPGAEVLSALADPTRWRVLELHRRARRGHGDDAVGRAARQPRRRGQAPRGARPRRARRGPPRRPRGPLHGAHRAGSSETARWMAGLASRWDARLEAIKRLAEEG